MPISLKIRFVSNARRRALSPRQMYQITSHPSTKAEMSGIGIIDRHSAILITQKNPHMKAIDRTKGLEVDFYVNPGTLVNQESLDNKCPTVIHRTSVIHPRVQIGKNVYIGPNCIIGFSAEIRNEPYHMGHVVIGDNVRIEFGVTIDSGSTNYTIIHQDVMIMKQVHIGHDAQIGEGCTLSPGSRIGGHAHIGKGTNVGMNAVIHQRVSIPEGCMIGMGAILPKNKNLQPYRKYIHVAVDIGENKRG
jgi:UDP-N-acetylglucosamine acyltransferase